MTNYDSFKKGDIGPISDKKIKHIVQQDAGYIIFLDESDDIFWTANAEYDIAKDRAGDILNQVGFLTALSEKVLPTKNEIFKTKCQIAKVYSRLIAEKDKDAAKELLDSILNRLVGIGKENYRITYLSASLLSTIVVLALLSIFWIVRNNFIPTFGSLIFYGIICSLAGGIGAFISTFIRAKNYDANIHISKRVHILDGVMRIFYGIVAGLIIYVGIKANLILGFVNTINGGNSLFFFLSFVAGASESLLPNIIKQTEEKNSSNRNADK
jgi:hypothetical protein